MGDGEVAVRGQDVAPAIDGLATELKARSASETSAGETAPVFLFIHGLQKFKKLRHEDDFSFSASSSESGPDTGAQFNQTQYCYDLPLLSGFMEQVEALGLLGKIYILAGVGPLRSAKTAEWMRKNVPGMHVPDAVIARLSGASDQAREGRNICIELIQSIREIRGISGIHIMAYRQEESVAEIVDRSAILKGRAPWYPARDSNQVSERTAS